MHSSKNGSQWYFGSVSDESELKAAHVGVDADSGLVHPVKGTAGQVRDINEALHGQEQTVFADTGYRGIEKQPDARPEVRWHEAMLPGQRKALDKTRPADALLDATEKLTAAVRAKV